MQLRKNLRSNQVENIICTFKLLMQMGTYFRWAALHTYRLAQTSATDRPPASSLAKEWNARGCPHLRVAFNISCAPAQPVRKMFASHSILKALVEQIFGETTSNGTNNNRMRFEKVCVAQNSISTRTQYPSYASCDANAYNSLNCSNVPHKHSLTHERLHTHIHTRCMHYHKTRTENFLFFGRPHYNACCVRPKLWELIALL